MKLLRVEGLSGGFESEAPVQIVGQVPGRDAVEAAHPLLETLARSPTKVNSAIGLNEADFVGGGASKELLTRERASR